MTKRARLTAAAVVAILCAAVVPASAKTFVNATGEWEFRYPNEFVIRETSSTQWALANFSLGRPRPLRDGQFRIDFQIASSDTKTVERLIREECKPSDGLEANECDDTTIRGLRWARVLRGGNGSQDTELTVATVANGKSYEATATIPDGDEEAVSLGLVEAIIDTFELSPTGTPVSSGSGGRRGASGGSGIARTGSESVAFLMIGMFAVAVGGMFRLAWRKL